MAVITYTQGAVLGAYQNWLMQQGAQACLQQVIKEQEKTSSVEGAAGCCTQQGDKLMIEVFNAEVGTQLRVNWRMRLANGRLVDGSRTYLPPANGNWERDFYPLPAGCLCSLTISDQKDTMCWGTAWAKVSIVGGTVSDPLPYQALVSGYMARGVSLSYPGTGLNPGYEGVGRQSQTTKPNPAAGTNFAHDQEALGWWRIKQITVRLTTSAAVANRLMVIGLQHLHDQETTLIASQTQPASRTVDYIFQAGAAYASPTQSRILGNLPDPLILADGDMFSDVENLQAGDQISDIKYNYEEWLNVA